MIKLFFFIFVPALVITAFLSSLHPLVFWPVAAVVVPLFLLGVYDLLQRKHTILRNFPVLGHFRFLFEMIRPEIFQYLIESDWDGRPFNRIQRSVVYRRAKGTLDTHPYGTLKNVLAPGYEWIDHSFKARRILTPPNPVIVGEKQCKQPYAASILNISAMSFGALSPEAITALNWGAKKGGFYHNTGEGGISSYHLKHGGDLVWQIGTAYFGCRTPSGEFCPLRFKEKATLPNVKMIEIKLSQGAKPGHGGILPAIKITPEIAAIRHVELGKDVISPPAHTAFSNPIEFLNFIATLRELSGGKPVGFKLCLGRRKEFLSLCKAMLKTGLTPDFITVDGAEGGTGAAPLEFSNAVGTPLIDALPFVHNALIGINMRDRVRVIASGKLTTAFEIVSKLALGADMCSVARAMMMALGCIQSIKCNTNKCPTGITTQDPTLRYGLVVKDKYERVARYHKETVKNVMDMVGAAGLNCHTELQPCHVYRRINEVEVKRLDEVYPCLKPGDLLKETLPKGYEMWEDASADEF